MTVKSLITLLEKRKSDIQLKFQETSGIYSAKSSSMSLPGPSPGANLSTDDRLRLFALENERLRALLKSINEQTETELQVINSALLELSQTSDSQRKYLSEIDRLKEERRVLDAKLQTKDMDRSSLLDQISKFESILASEKARSSELQTKIDSLKRELDTAQSNLEARRQTGEIDLLFRQRIQQLEKTVKDSVEERATLKAENAQLRMQVSDLMTKVSLSTPLKLEVRNSEVSASKSEPAERKIIEAIDTVKNELANFQRTQKQVLEKINEDADRKHLAASQDHLRFKTAHNIDVNAQRSLYRKFPQAFEQDNLDPHVDLSLNMPPDYEGYDAGQNVYIKKLKQVVKLLTDKQTNNLKTIEEKTEKLKELKKTNKELTREVETLRADNKAQAAEALKAEGQLRKLREEVDRLKLDKERATEAQSKLQKKLDKQERKLQEFRDSEQRIQSLEKQKELMMNVNNQRNAEIQSLLSELNDKQDALNQVVSRSQMQIEASQVDEGAGALRARYLKLKRLFLGLREAYFQLQDEYTQLSAELEKEVRLRETILEDFLKRSDFFEAKIGEFRDFHDRIIDVKRLIISKRLDE